ETTNQPPWITESKEESKKKPVLGRFGQFFTTGRRKTPKNRLEASLRPSVKNARSESPSKDIAPLASIDFDDLKDLSKSEESLIDQVYDQVYEPNQAKIHRSVEDIEEYIYNRDLTPLYNDIVSEWNNKGINSESECSPDWHSSSETIRNTVNSTTPNFFRSLTNISSEDLESSILDHKNLVDAPTLAESECAESKDEPSIFALKPSEEAHSPRVLTVDIFLCKSEDLNSSEPVTTVLGGDCSSTDIMDKKSAVRRSGKRRKSQSSSDTQNGERNTAENTGKDESVFDGGSSDLVSGKTNVSERKTKISEQINSPTGSHDARTGSKGLHKAELEKGKQQASNSSPYKRKSLKKTQSDAGPLSPTSVKSHGKESSTRRLSDSAVDGNSAPKSPSVEKLSPGENAVETSKGSSVGITNNSTLPLSDDGTQSKVLDPPHNSGGSLLHTDKLKSGEMGKTNGKQTSSDTDGAKQRNTCFDVSRTVTTKVSLPAKPKNIELNLKASKTLEDAKADQDSVDKSVKINFSIANKISMFENKNQSAEVSSSKRDSVSNVFVGRAKLKFGKQHTENDQSSRTARSNIRQKPLQNDTKVKDATSDAKIKSSGRNQPSTIRNDAGKAAESQVKQNGTVEDSQVTVLISEKIDGHSVEDNLLPQNESVQQTKETGSFQNKNEMNTNVRSVSPEGRTKPLLETNTCSPSEDDKAVLPCDPVPKTLDLEQNTTLQSECEDKNMANTVLENIQLFEQSISGQNSSNGFDTPRTGNEDVICDSPEMAKFTETLKNLDSSVCVPQRKKKVKLPKSPAPHFAMPPIREDNLEKIFDPNVFTVGLGIKRDKLHDLTPSVQLKLQSLETEARVRPKRASTENSILLQSLKLSNRADPVHTQELGGKDNKESVDGEIKRSRLESSAIFSSLLSPMNKEQMFTPSVTSVNAITTSFAAQKTADSAGIPPLVFDVSHILLVSWLIYLLYCDLQPLSGFKAPNYMDKYLQTDDAKKERILQVTNLGNRDSSVSSWLMPGQHEGNGFLDVEVGFFIIFLSISLRDAFSGNNQTKINPRPGKIVICNKSDALEDTIEVFNDVLDCTSWVLSPMILVRVIRGCWILYEKPNFEGPSIPLEEGEIELTNLWGEETSDSKEEEASPEPATIGSIRHVVKDYRLCHIDLFTEPEGLGIVNSYFDDTEEMRFSSAQKTSSIQVHWGIWLLYEEPGFQGIPLMLEPGEYPNLSFWKKKEAYIRSLRPLKMGGRKVEYPENPKVIIYEKPFFEGRHVELDSGLEALPEGENQKEDSAELGVQPFTSVGSIKVKGGIWVAYEKPQFAGHQYLLEEGEYQEWMDWGGYDEQVQSLRPVLGSFTQPHMIMFTEKDLGTKGSNISVLGIISNLKDTGYGLRTQSINVLSGVWVAYENPDFTGEQYILDKGMYPHYETWGGRSCKISSVQPIILVQLFSEPGFQGSSKILEKDTSQIEDTFHVKSSKVLSGSWVAYEKENFSGNQYVLEEGAYPDLSAMGCLPKTHLKSLQVINIELSEPVITLFEKENFKGKKIEFSSEVVNVQFLGYNLHIASVEVCGGTWIVYEHSNYRGHQILLSPKKIPDWCESSDFIKIGSLRPLLQKQPYFRLQNKETRQFMSMDGNLDDLNLLRIQVAEDAKSDEQVWVYQSGFIKCKLAEDFCLTIVGNLITPGAKLGLALQQNEDKQKWNIHPDGRIYSKMKPNLVLDIKGGKHYDQNHLIVSSICEDKPTQFWEPLVM
uniref:Crystallin beta-gamma domain containing 1 n=1 Tax=Salvator merianae TaxID=96440 RepID=A0A8D0C4H0_SALMN